MEGGGCHTFGPPTVTLFDRRGQNCLYVTGRDETAIFEMLPSFADMDDVAYIASLKVERPIRLLNLIDNIRFQSGSDVPLWSYKLIFGPMFLNEDPTAQTEILEVSRLLAQRAFENGVEGMLYPSRASYMANLKRSTLSIQYNFVIFGSPIREGKLSFNPSTVKTYQVVQLCPRDG